MLCYRSSESDRVALLADAAAHVCRELLAALPEAVGVPVSVRVRHSVWATHYRPPHPSCPHRPHVIQIGTRMVAHQLEAAAASDTAGRERRRFGLDRPWGDTPRARLACVLVHEIAHLVTHLRHQPERRLRTHGREFQAVLLELHARGFARRAWEGLRDLAPAPELDRPFPPNHGAPTLRRRPSRPTRSPHPATTAVAPGDRVVWPDHRGGSHTGTVRRVNRRTVTVTEDGRPPHQWWRVPPHLLRRRG
ncbi:MAG TPA: hypothetical protein PLP31_13855 [Thermoanaerobaculaceae bacterium]|nr:hypothetical protein [Thermoanaerobaculaceae bacterium]